MSKENKPAVPTVPPVKAAMGAAPTTVPTKPPGAGAAAGKPGVAGKIDGKPGAAGTSAKADTKGVAGAEGEDEEEEEDYSPNFWQQKWVQSVLPFCTSLALHAGIIVVGLVTVKTIEKVVRVVQEQIVIPDSTLVGDGEVGGIPNPGLGGDPTRAAAQMDDASAAADSQGIADKKGPTQIELAGGAGESSADSVIGIGAATAYGSGNKTGIGAGTGKGSNTGELAPFGMPGGGGGIGPKSNFMGSGGNAMTVAFVCDASGSMLGQQFDLLRDEIRKSVDKLRPIQGFDVIFFQDESCSALTDTMHSGTLLMANPDVKRKTLEFLNQIGTVAGTNPIPAIKHAIKMKPQLIYLLTDGAFDNPSNKEVLEEVRKMNADKKVKINTIGFYRQGIPKNERDLGDDVLSTIAKENGGTFRVVMTSDLLK